MTYPFVRSDWNLFYSADVSAALKVRIEKFVHDLSGLFACDVASWHDQNVGIVVQACHVCDFRNPNEGSSDALMLVQCHGNAFAATADGNAFFAFSVFDASCQCVCKVGVVAAFFALGAIVLIWHPFFVKIFFDELFEFKSGVVACQSNWEHNEKCFMRRLWRPGDDG